MRLSKLTVICNIAFMFIKLVLLNQVKSQRLALKLRT